MLLKRIIPCLDVKNGRVVKGINFVGLKDVGDPVECAKAYNAQGADELVFLDITATNEQRDTIEEVVRNTAREVFMPLTVGGGIRTIDDFRRLLRAGADKISVNSAAVSNPEIISEAADIFGSQCVVVAIDAKRCEGNFHVVVNGGRIDTGLDAIEWAKKVETLGAGEILLTSMDADGTKAGFDIELLNAITAVVSIPIIASGGCGTLEHFSELFEQTNADAALAASLFHYKELTVSQVKDHLTEHGIPVRVDKNSKLNKYFTNCDLIPAIVVEEKNGEVLMLAYMNKESLAKTLKTGFTWFYSRSRGELWNKGATSGHFQKVVSIKSDCDDDTLLVTVNQTGVACHTGSYSCFFNEV